MFDNRYRPVERKTKISVRNPGIFYGLGEEDDAFPSIPLVSTFKSEGENFFLAYWIPWHPQEIIREGQVDLVAAGVQFKDPVLIDLLDGEVYKVDCVPSGNSGVLFRNIPLADYPFVIAERSEIVLME